ncbi:MAG: phosphate signaling complex protein PhoU [Candidatus Hermodarchaeota archaeon]
MATKMRNQILELKKEVIEMGHLALEMLDDSMKALSNQDIELAKETEEKKHRVRELDADIEAKALKIIALYQPMAIDLRRLATILKMITYLARLGRYGKDIASAVEELSVKPYPAPYVNLRHMWEHVKTMIIDALKAFEESDINYIEHFTSRDDEIDKMRWSIFRECITYMMENPKTITPCAFFMMIARYLERCGDNACKIAEKVYYMVTGEHKEIT